MKDLPEAKPLAEGAESGDKLIRQLWDEYQRGNQEARLLLGPDDRSLHLTLEPIRELIRDYPSKVERAMQTAQLEKRSEAAKRAAAIREQGREPDLLDWIEGNYPNGVRVTNVNEFGSYVDRATGLAKKLLFKEKGEPVDTAMVQAAADGFVFQSQDEFLQAMLDAGASRKDARERGKKEEEATILAGRWQDATRKGKWEIKPEKLKIGAQVMVDFKWLPVKRVDERTGEVTLAFPLLILVRLAR